MRWKSSLGKEIELFSVIGIILDSLYGNRMDIDQHE